MLAANLFQPKNRRFPYKMAYPLLGNSGGNELMEKDE
jgi:hypothetical protein